LVGKKNHPLVNDHIAIAGKNSPFLIGNTSTESGSIFQPAMLVYRSVGLFVQKRVHKNHSVFHYVVSSKVWTHVSYKKWRCPWDGTLPVAPPQQPTLSGVYGVVYSG